LTAPDVIPATIWRLKMMYMISIGMVMTRMLAKRRLNEFWLWLM